MIKGKLTLRSRRSLLGLFFIMPWLLGFVFLFAAPLLQSIQFSLSQLTIVPTGFTLDWVGFGNYNRALFIDPNFNRILTDSITGMMVQVPLILFFSLFVATLLNQKFKGRSAARAIFFLPVILASGAVAAAESSGLIGLLGSATTEEATGAQSTFNALGLIYLLADAGMPDIMIDYIVNAIFQIYDIITASGVQILIFLAALQSVPGAMYEVAKIEGATAYESFWKITFPMVSPLILTNVIYTIIDSFADSQITQTIYSTAFQAQNFGLSAAMSWLYTIIVGLLLVIIGYMISRRVFYYN